MLTKFFDSLVAVFSPTTALERSQARARLHVANNRQRDLIDIQERKYDAAAKSRHRSDWHSESLSVNQEVIQALSTLRSRSQDLSRNNPYAINAIRTLRNNVVGTGIMPSPTMQRPRAKQSAVFKDQWETWAEQTSCDYYDVNTFGGLQSLAFRTVIVSGECFVRRIWGDNADSIPLKIRLYEGDFLDSSKHTGDWAADDTMLFYGIKLHRSGKRLGYWLFMDHPQERSGISEYVSADDILHLYEVERPGQMRGVPLSCGAMTKLKDLDDYELTELQRAKIAASFSVFITDKGAGDIIDTARSKQKLTRVSPGMIAHLEPGQEVAIATPPTTQGYNDYVKAHLRGASAGYGTTYEAMTNDYSNVNFSSGRMGWLESARNYEQYQWFLMIPRFCEKVYAWYVLAAKLKGYISADAKVKVTWTPPRRSMIDPSREIPAMREEIRAGLSSWSEVVRSLGINPEQLQEQLKQDKTFWDGIGLMPTSDPRYDNNRPKDTTD